MRHFTIILFALLLLVPGCAVDQATRASTVPGTVRQGPASTVSGAERDVVRTYTDGAGNRIQLKVGRATGHRGDWGWSHIKMKHIEGRWGDGGTVTTFPQALGTSTDDQVQELIGESLLERAAADRGGTAYRHPVAGSRYEVLVVVGRGGDIITAYPLTSSRRGR